MRIFSSLLACGWCSREEKRREGRRRGFLYKPVKNIRKKFEKERKKAEREE